MAPLIAVAGMLLVALLGFYQWRKQYSNANRAANAAGRRQAYESLWQKLEAINLDLREQRVGNPGLFEQLREMNTFFLAHSLYFEDRDQVLINEYIAAMNVLRERVYTSGSEETVSAFQVTMNPSFPRVEQEIREAVEQVERLRARLKKKVQQVAASS
ncbi:MAG TPA: hypothetical protein VHX20_12905 [Terracidiphilus sp.]|jgi:hypothetical protein|nr:hypothetical protein [Terracidiphilus sp.]